MKTKTGKNLATIALDDGAIVERKYAYLLPMFDNIYGPVTIFVREEDAEGIVICRVYTENNRFLTDETITPAELEGLRKESKEYLEEVLEEVEALNEELEETFTGGLEKPFSKQTEVPYIMFV